MKLREMIAMIADRVGPSARHCLCQVEGIGHDGCGCGCGGSGGNDDIPAASLT